MVDRFKWCHYSILVVIIHFIVFPIITNTVDVAHAEGVESTPIPSKDATSRVNASTDPGVRQLSVEITTDRETVEPGEFVGYDLTVANTSRSGASSSIRILDVLPAGFKLKSGSVSIDGVKGADPVVSGNGKNLIFTVGKLSPTGVVKLHFETVVTVESKPGKAVNYASAVSSGGNSDVAKAAVTVKENMPATKTALPESAPVVPGNGVNALTAVPISPGVSSPPVLTPEPALLKTPVNETKPADDRAVSSTVVAEPFDLLRLIGKADVSVLADADGQFIKSMTENNLLEKESASQVSETNLLDSIRSGRSFSRESHAALARTEQANAQTGQAFALLMPSVAVRASSGSETSKPSVKLSESGIPLSSDTHTRTDASLTVRQPLFDLPSFRDWRRREVIELSRGENYRVSDGDAYLSSVNAYLSLVSSRLQTDMTREFETQLNELLTYIEKRASAGAASVSDMARVRARKQATLSSRLEQESAHAAAGVEFVRLTNLVPRKVRLPVLEDVGASLLPKSVDGAVIEAMKSNPEIAALNAELQAAEIDVSIAKGRYLPRVDAEYTDSLSIHAGGDPSSAGQRDKRAMLVLNWSLFNGGSDYKSTVERTARHKELQYRLDDQRRRVVQALSANYAVLATTNDRIASGYQELKSITTAAEAMSKRMLSGNQSLLDLLDVYDRFYQVRSRLVNLHILEMNTVAQLVRITRGTPGAVPVQVK